MTVNSHSQSEKDKVLKIRPDLRCWNHFGGNWKISKVPFSKGYGFGQTKAAAWADAWRYLK